MIIIKKKLIIIGGVIVIATTIALGVGLKNRVKKEKITLYVWTSVEDQDIIQEAADEFAKAHSTKQTDVEVQVQMEDVSGTKKMVLEDLSKAADVYNFANDQFIDLMNVKALLPVTNDEDEVIKNSGGEDDLCISTVMVDNKLYAYPYTTGNGYFLFYNKEYYKDNQVGTMDELLSIASNNNKKVAMNWSSGWYTYSFFGAAGMSVNITEDGKHNVCDYNSTEGEVTGLDVTKAMLNIAKNKGFYSAIDDEMIKAVEKGDIIATVSGTWNATALNKIWGDNCSAAKLPTYTVNGKQLQMKSFTGFKYFGVNSKTKYPELSMELANYITNYENQMKRYEVVGECPSNIEAVESDAVKKSVAITALHEQSKYAITQNVCEQYWDAMTLFGSYIASGNKDNVDLQELLDSTVEAIEK